MKNTILSIFLFLLLTGFVKAQAPVVEWLMKNTRAEGTTYIEKIISYDDNGLLALRGRQPMMTISHTKLFLQHLDNEFKPGTLTEIPFRLSTDKSLDFGKIPDLLSVDKLAEDAFIFTSSLNKDNFTYSLFAKKIDLETLDVDNEGILLYEITLPAADFRGPKKDVKVKPTGPISIAISVSDAETRLADDNFHIARSSDGKNILTIFNYPACDNQQRKFIINVYNDKLQLVWKKEVTVNYPSLKLFYNECSIDNEGNVAISTKLYKDKTVEIVARKVNYEFILFYIPANGGEVVETKLAIAGSALARLVQTFDKKGNIVCGGLYTSPSTSNAKGAFIIQTEPAKGAITNSSIKQFGTAFTNSCISEDVKRLRKISQDVFEDYGFVIDKLEVLENGEIKMVAEQKFYFHYLTTDTHFDASNKATSENRYRSFISFENIFCASADNTGTIQWLTRIPKKQYTNQGFDSYFLKIFNGTLYFFYNDALENIRLNKSIYYEARGKFIPVVSSIDKSGTLTTDELWDPGTDKVMLVPKSGFSVSDNEMIVEAQKGKSDFFAKISFK